MSAARLAADDVVEQAKQLVADYLEASPADIVLDPAVGRLHVAGDPSSGISWADLASRASADERLGELKAEHEFQAAPTFPFGAHVAVVEVDTETAKVELLRLDRRRRRRHADQPADRGGAGARRRRDRRGAGALRAGRSTTRTGTR